MIRSRATAALLRLKEIDNKYKVRYDESKNEARSSVKTESLVSDEDTSDKTPRHSSSSEKLEILKPTLSIKIPDTSAEQLDSETSSSNEPSSSQRVSAVDKTPVVTPRVESTSEIKEAIDEDESIDEILEEFNDSEASDDIEGIQSEKSNGKKTSSLFNVENFSARKDEPNIDYSNESFENDTSDAESLTSDCSPKKHSESLVESKKSGLGEEDEVSLTNVEEESIASENEKLNVSRLSKRSTSDETEVEVQSPIDRESQSSPTVKNLPLVELNLKPSEDCAIAEDGGKNEDASGSLRFVNLSHERLDLSPGTLEDSNSIDKLASGEELSTSLQAKNTPHVQSNVTESKLSSMKDGDEKHQESKSRKTTHSPRAPLELSSDKHGYSNPSNESTINAQLSKSAELADASSKLDAKKEPIHSHKKLLKTPIKGRRKSKDRSYGNEPEDDTFYSRSSSQRSSSQEISERVSASSNKRLEVAPPKIIDKAASKSQSAFDTLSSRDPSRNLGIKFSEPKKKLVSTSGFHRRSKSKERGVSKTLKSARINRFNEEVSFEYRDQELERLKVRISDLKLEQERQLMLCYMKDFDEDRRRLTLLSSQFYCPRKSKLSVIEPLDLPNVANFVKADGTGVRCGVLFPDDRLELVRSRLADIRQWLKDQFILYRDYSEVASAINAKYVTDKLAAEKVRRSAAARSRRETPEVRRYRETSRRQPEVAVGSRSEDGS